MIKNQDPADKKPQRSRMCSTKPPCIHSHCCLIKYSLAPSSCNSLDLVIRTSVFIIHSCGVFSRMAKSRLLADKVGHGSVSLSHQTLVNGFSKSERVASSLNALCTDKAGKKLTEKRNQSRNSCAFEGVCFGFYTAVNGNCWPEAVQRTTVND